MGTNVSKIS
jgi:hypothetical protein